MAKWEFKLFREDDPTASVEKPLNGLAQEGWEIVTAQFVSVGEKLTLCALLKRPPKGTKGGAMVTP